MFDLIVALAQELLIQFSTARKQPHDARAPAAVVLLGSHEIRTTLAAANYLSALDAPVPIFLCGRVGRGTYHLRREFARFLIATNRRLPTMYATWPEAKLNEHLLRVCGVTGPICLETQSGTTPENFANLASLLAAQHVTPGAEIALFQAHVNRYRAQISASDFCPGFRFATIATAPLILSRLPDEEKVVTELYRLFGWPSLGIESESEILDCYYESRRREFLPDTLFDRAAEGVQWFANWIETSTWRSFLLESVVASHQ